MALHESRQCFLQACSNHGTLSLVRAMKILSTIYQKYEESEPTTTDLKEVVDEINNAIGIFDQKIKFIKHDLVGKEFLVFSHTAEAEINKFQNCFTEADRNYFSQLLEAIALSEEQCIHSIVALNLTNNPNAKKFSKSHAEKLTDEWLRLGYFLLQDDLIYFGPKTLADFSNYLRINYSDNVQECPLCKTTVFWGVDCESCKVKLHRDCMKKYLSKMSKCPSCNQLWNQAIS